MTANYPTSAPPADLEAAAKIHGEGWEEVYAIGSDLVGTLGRGTPGVGAYVTGRYYDGSINAVQGSTQTFSNNFTHLTPFWSHSAASWDRVAIGVTAAVAGAVRLGVYAADASTGWPSNGPLNDWGTVDPGTTGLKEITISFTTTAHTLYWLALSSSANNVGLRSRGSTTPFNGYSSGTVDNNTEQGNYLSSAGGTLATTGGVPNQLNAFSPRIMLRAA
jgi:hypothetical protein